MAELNLNFYRVFKARTESWATDCVKDILGKWDAFEDKAGHSLRITFQIDDDIPEDLLRRRLYCVEDMLISNNLPSNCTFTSNEKVYLVTVEVSEMPAEAKSRLYNCDSEVCQCADTKCH